LHSQVPITINPLMWSNVFRQGVQANTMPGVYNSRRAYLSITEMQNVAQNSMFTYDQYEVMSLSLPG
jgi:hypothetical protein